MQEVESADMCVQMYGTEVESRPKNNTQVKYGYQKKVFVFVTSHVRLQLMFVEKTHETSGCISNEIRLLSIIDYDCYSLWMRLL